MNTSTWLNFTGFPDQSVLNQNFSDTFIGTSEQQKATYQMVANACQQDWYKPIFDAQPQQETTPDTEDATAVVLGGVEVIPVDLKEESASKGAIDVVNSTEPPKEEAPLSKSLTIPPIKIEQNELMNAVLIGLGVVFVLKILE